MTYHIQQAYCMSKDLESGAMQLMEAFWKRFICCWGKTGFLVNGYLKVDP